MITMGPTILVLWLTGAAFNKSETYWADGRGSLAMQEFNNGSKCQNALEEIKKLSKYTITGVCLPK